MKRNNFRLNGFVTILLLTGFLFSGIGCWGPQGPTFKEKVNQALEHYYRGEKLERKQDLEGARDEYLASVQITPRPRAYFRLAAVLNALGKKDEAEKYLNEAIRLSPGYVIAAQAKQQLKGGPNAASNPPINPAQPPVKPPSTETVKTSAPKAVMETTQGVAAPVAVPTTPPKEIVPLDAAAQGILTQAKEAGTKGDWSRSSQLCEEILKRFPEHPEALYRYGYASFQLNKLADAEKAFRHASESDPNLAAAFNDLGVTLEKLNRSSEAAKAYERAVQINNFPDSCFNLALLKEKAGDYKAAISLYEKYLKQDSSSTFANYAKERIQKLQRAEY